MRLAYEPCGRPWVGGVAGGRRFFKNCSDMRTLNPLQSSRERQSTHTGKKVGALHYPRVFCVGLILGIAARTLYESESLCVSGK
jgi:hypothetical protein